MFKNQFKVYLLLFFIVFLSSCSNKPPILNTTLPLVNETSSNYVDLNRIYQSFLNSSEFKFVDDKENILVKEKSYLSALGSTCYKLSLSNYQEIKSDSYTACKSSDLWHLVPDILNTQKTIHLLVTQ